MRPRRTGKEIHPIKTALDPRTGHGSIEVGILLADIRRMNTYGHTTKVFQLKEVQEVLTNPLAIFEGWGRPGTEQNLCYAGLPREESLGVNQTMPRDPGCAFLVYVLDDLVVDDWMWKPFDERTFGEDLKSAFGKDFGRCLWHY